MGQNFCCNHGSIGGGHLWHLDVRWKELYGVCDAFMPCFGAVEFVAPVVLWCWSDVPAISTMWCPGLAHAGLLMDDDSCSNCGVLLKSKAPLSCVYAARVGVCRELVVDLRVA
jgi:hypothetical protein